jgi:hypothetical protein
MRKIKLLQVDTMEDGTIRLQSQLMIGRDSVDFIMKDEVLKCYGQGKHGFDFYEYKEPFEIVKDRKDMKYQQL